LDGFADVGNLTIEFTTNWLLEIQIQNSTTISHHTIRTTISSYQNIRKCRNNYHQFRSQFKKQKIVHSLIDSVIKIAHLFESKMIYSTEGVPVETVERIERKAMQFLTTNAEMEIK
jgi:hypothetical protein